MTGNQRMIAAARTNLRRSGVGVFRCPSCGRVVRGVVIDTRDRKDNSVRRRRQCEFCPGRLTAVKRLAVKYLHEGHEA